MGTQKTTTEKSDDCWDEDTWYNGRQTKTAEGDNCVVWDDVSWGRYKSFGGDENENYCRHASSTRFIKDKKLEAEGPWCYISTRKRDSLWRKKSCGIPKCSDRGTTEKPSITGEVIEPVSDEYTGDN